MIINESKKIHGGVSMFTWQTWFGECFSVAALQDIFILCQQGMI